MKNKKALSCIISAFLLVTLSPIPLFANDIEINVDTPNDLEITKYAVQKYTNEQENKLTVDMPNKYSRVFGHNTAGTAFNLSGGNLNSYIGDTANELPNWYYFQTTKTDKISVFLKSTLTGDYDLYLYKYEADGTLTLVSNSQYTGEDEHISYVGDSSGTGYYWLLVNPYTPADPSETYTLRVDTLSTFDSYEPNDNTAFSSPFVGSIDASATIDNPLDVDSYSLEVKTSGRYVINLSNVQTGGAYAVDIYDKDFNYFGNFVSTGESEAYISTNANETYYFKVRSNDGTYNSQHSYKLKVMELHGNGLIATPNGQHIDITAQNIYIDGIKVPLTWNYDYRINYTRTEELTKNSDYYINLDPSLYHRKGFTKGAETESNNAIAITMTNASTFYFYYPYSENETYNYQTSKNISSSGGTNPLEFFIDLDTKKMFDYTRSGFYWHEGKSQTSTAIGRLGK